MTTELELVFQKNLGPPTHSRGDGQSQWDCPQCGHPRFHTMPDVPQYKHRYRCWVCDFRGDVLDAIAYFEPALTYGQRLARLDQLRAEFERQSKSKPVASFSRGAGGNRHICLRCKTRGMSKVELEIETFSPAASSAVDELVEGQITLSIARQVLEICAKHGVHPAALSDAVHFESWSRDWESRHLAGCDDPECDAQCCRLARS